MAIKNKGNLYVLQQSILLYSDFKVLFPECTDQLNILANSTNAEETEGIHKSYRFRYFRIRLNDINSLSE